MFFQAQAQGSTKVYQTDGLTGRYVYIRLLGNEARILTLCEVEVSFQERHRFSNMKTSAQL